MRKPLGLWGLFPKGGCDSENEGRIRTNNELMASPKKVRPPELSMWRNDRPEYLKPGIRGRI